MVVRLLEYWNGYVAGTVMRVSDGAASALIKEGVAEVFTPNAEPVNDRAMSPSPRAKRARRTKRTPKDAA